MLNHPMKNLSAAPLVQLDPLRSGGDTERASKTTPNVVEVRGNVRSRVMIDESCLSRQQLTAHQKANLEATTQLCQTAGIRFRCRHECGSAAEQIIRVAEDEGVDLIVMGTKGLSDWKALSLGAVNHPV